MGRVIWLGINADRSLMLMRAGCWCCFYSARHVHVRGCGVSFLTTEDVDLTFAEFFCGFDVLWNWETWIRWIFFKVIVHNTSTNGKETCNTINIVTTYLYTRESNQISIYCGILWLSQTIMPNIINVIWIVAFINVFYISCYRKISMNRYREVRLWWIWLVHYQGMIQL